MTGNTKGSGVLEGDRMKKRVLASLFAATVGVAGVIAVAQTMAEKGGTMTVALPGDIISLDPAFDYDFNTSPVVQQLVEGLQRFDENNKVVPNIAESVSNPNPLTYIYKIRKDVTFWDGTPVTIDDVLFSMERVKDPKTASYVGWMYQSVKSITKVDAQTVKVTLSKPDALWQYVGATTGASIIKKSYALEKGKTFGKPDGGVMATGPYKYTSWTTGQEIVIERNETYWNAKAGGPYLDKVTFKVIPEPTTQIAGLKTGEINLLIGVPLNLLPVAKGIGSVNTVLEPSFLFDFIAFNAGRKPFNDVKVRQALALAFDKKKLHDAIVKDAGDLAKNTPVNPALWIDEKAKWEAAYKALPEAKFDLAKAKALMKASSQPKGFTATVTTDSNPIRLNGAIALQAAAKTIGITLNIKKVTGEELNTLSFSKARGYDIIMQMWGSDFPDASGNLRPLFASANRGDGGSNFSNYSNPKVDALLEQQNQSTDPAKRAQLMIQVQKTLAEEVPMIVLNYQRNIAAISKNYKGFKLNPLWYWDGFLKDVSMTK
jgi:peptide/nickel transport system substrate-binding protein